MNEPLAWICVPIHEPHPIMSILEVVKTPVSERKCLPEDQTRPTVASEGYTRRTHRHGKDEYSKMVDSEEEKDVSGVTERDDGWSSSEEEPDASGYEQHFMPTAVEILEA